MLTSDQIFSQFKKTVSDKVNGLVEAYFQHKTYRNFKARCAIIDAAIDGKFNNQNSYVADVAPMIIRKDYNTTTAFLWKYFENDPIITLKSIGSTPQQNADKMQGVLQSNFTATRFRESALLPIFDNLSRYGTCAAFAQFDDSYDSGGEITMAAGEDAMSPFQSIENEGKKVVEVKSVHPLNVFMDPKKNFQCNSSYIGFIDSWFVSDLYNLRDNPAYNQGMLAEAIELCKKGVNEKFWYGGVESEVEDYSRGMIHPIRCWTTLPIEGNESDGTIYYCEMIHDKLVRCQPAGIPKSKIPLQVGTYYPRPDMWMGNANLEFKMAFQNLKNWIIGSAIENTMKQMDKIILTRRGGPVNVADLNMRHQTGGIVYYDGQPGEDPSKLLYPVQFQNPSRNDSEWLNREVNQMTEELSPVVNLQNKYNQGGLNNSTLGAAQMQAGIGEVLFGFVMTNVSFFISRVGAICTDLLQRELGDVINYRPSDMQDQQELSKVDILGEYVYDTQTSYFTNEKGERIDAANMITQVINWQATQRPEFNRFNLNEMIDDYMRAWKGSGADIEKYLAAVQQQLPSAMQQSPTAPGQMMPEQPPAPPVSPSSLPVTGNL